MEQVTEASDKVISLCEKYGVDRKQAFNVGLCLEELAANSLFCMDTEINRKNL